MIYLVFALVFLGLITALGSFLGRKKGEEEAPLIVNDSCSTCTGENDPPRKLNIMTMKNLTVSEVVCRKITLTKRPKRLQK